MSALATAPCDRMNARAVSAKIAEEEGIEYQFE
jgi:hypothetical protein